MMTLVGLPALASLFPRVSVFLTNVACVQVFVLPVIMWLLALVSGVDGRCGSVCLSVCLSVYLSVGLFVFRSRAIWL